MGRSGQPDGVSHTTEREIGPIRIRIRCRVVDSADRRSSYCDQAGHYEEVAMKYVMLIYQGVALEQQAALPEEEKKKVYADYQGINQTTGVTPGLPMGLPQNATTVGVRRWQGREHRWPLRRNEGGHRRLVHP